MQANESLNAQYTEVSSKVQGNVAKSKELTTKLIAAEQRVEELQKKSDEYRRGCLKYQAEREKLRAELEKIKQQEPDAQPET